MRYERQGLLAINPQAFFDVFADAPDRANTADGDVAVVDIRGPLEQYANIYLGCDSYESILERVSLACESSAKVIVLRIDSPGGQASGMVDTTRAIRARCDAAGKRLVSFVEGQGCSAAYALACAASEIVASETAVLGSIGIINCRIDVTELDKATGTRFAITTSGARKSDGHPHVAVSEAELASTQRLVDSLAVSFFDLVSEARGISREDVARHEAAVFHGATAEAVGLVDRVQSFDGLLASLASAESGEPMSKTKYEEARAALDEVAKGEGEEAVRARKALAAMDDGPDEKEKKDEDEAEDEKPEDEAKAEDGPPADEEKEEAKASASRHARVSASTAGAIAALSTDLAARVARLEAQNEALERRQFLSSRPDLPTDLVRVLATKPLADVRAIVSAIPAPRTPKLGDKAAAANVTPTQGDAAATGPRLPPDAKARLDREMGLAPTQSIGVEKTPYRLVLGAPVDVRKGA